MNNKKGFTLVELLVYMAIIGVIVIVAGQAFSNSTKTRVRTQNMIKASSLAEQVGMLLRDDLAQMGVKSSLGASGFEQIPVSVAEDDKSSFVYFHDETNEFDSLSMLRVVNNDSGKCVRVEEVKWSVRDGILYRSCMTKSVDPDLCKNESDSENCPSTAPLAVQIADGVTKFRLIPATPNLLGGDQQIFPASSASGMFRMLSRVDPSRNIVAMSVRPQPDESASNVVRLSGFNTNYKETPAEGDPIVYHQAYVLDASSVSWQWKDCARIRLMKGATYEISFSMPVNEDASRMFRPGKDHFAVGIRDTKENLFREIADVPDVLVYPPETYEGRGVRRMRFSSKIAEDETDVCIAFTFATFSPLVGAGIISISNLKVMKIADDNYSFVPNYVPDVVDKPFVRAFKLELQLNRKGESGEVDLVIPVPSNGQKEE